MQNILAASTRRDPFRAAGAALLLLALAGCAGAHVGDVADRSPPGAAPNEILVDVDAASDNPEQDAQAERLAARLQTDLVQRLTAAHVTAERFQPGIAHPGTAVLHVAITRADPGSLAERFLIGFGFGRATLEAHAELVEPAPSGDASLTAFDTTSDSGMKPGLILPGGVALATANAIHLAIGGGIDVAMNLRGGLDRPTSQTAAAIVRQVRGYYTSAGWIWPGGDKA